MNRYITAPVTINYRNAIYQGCFNFDYQCPDIFGIYYATSNHQFIVSHWINGKLNGHTLIYWDHCSYMYGNWLNDYPHGSTFIRMGQNILICQYDMGTMLDKFLLLSQKYNLAAVYHKQQNSLQYSILQKGQLYTKQHFDQYMKLCQFQDFNSSYETLIKYISQNLINKYSFIKLVNNNCYRFGYQKGLAIIFNDQYFRSSIGVHNKEDLSGIGVKYKDRKVVQEGNWSEKCKVYAYQQQLRPHSRIQKVYYEHLLKGLNYINLFLKTPSQQYRKQAQQILTGDLSKQLTIGMITSNRLLSSRIHLQKSQKNEIITRQQQQKKQLQIIKQQIYNSIRNKKVYRQISDLQTLNKIKQQQKKRLISRSPVGKIIIRNQPKDNSNKSIKKNRSPIFSKSRSRSVSIHSPRQVSPYVQKIKSKIFDKSIKRSTISSQFEKYSNNQISPKKLIFNQNNNNKSSILKKYQSPYQNIQLSNSQNIIQSSLQYPITLKNIQSKKNVKIVNSQEQYWNQSKNQKQLKYHQKQKQQKYKNYQNQRLSKLKKVDKKQYIQKQQNKSKSPYNVKVSPPPYQLTRISYLPNNSVYLQQTKPKKQQKLKTSQKNKQKNFLQKQYESKNYKKLRNQIESQINNTYNKQYLQKNKLLPIKNNSPYFTPTKLEQKNNQYQKTIHQSPIRGGGYQYYFQ